ncbi:MAG: hypothetical protein GKS00_16460 [Alphaproteobacteria bacterium]|nr:hypothetical protein [Alphaproteobacteria bacterium]
MPIYQDGYDIRCEWGEYGVAEIASRVECCVIVGALSFSSCVDIATARGATVYPCIPEDDPKACAAALGAELAEKRGVGRYSLSPGTLTDIPSGTKLVLPSPNGSTLTRKTKANRLFAGCLRNARAVAAAIDGSAVIVPAAERWPDRTLRPAIEDIIAAGAIISFCSGAKSPEAKFAQRAFETARESLEQTYRECASGNELVTRGHEDDVRLCTELNVSDCVPSLVDGAYRNVAA